MSSGVTDIQAIELSASGQFHARVQRLMRSTGCSAERAIGKVRAAYPKLAAEADREQKAQAAAKAEADARGQP